MKLLFVGDIFGSDGRRIVRKYIEDIKTTKKIDFIVANGENAASGKGINYSIAQELFEAGIDVITMGNHTWSRKEIFNFIDDANYLIRPANYPKQVPGKGSCVIEKNGFKLGVVNLVGRVYMDAFDCPFQVADKEIKQLKNKVDSIIVDMHAEATSEKNALAKYLDGRVTAVVGTHTHVQTADCKITSNGTASITDVGMTGPADGIIGVDSDTILKKFLTGIPSRFEPAKGKVQLNAVMIEIDKKTGMAVDIQPINIIKQIV